MPFPMCRSSLVCSLLHRHYLSSSGWRGGRYQTTCRQCSQNHFACFVACMIYQTFGVVLSNVLICMCALKPWHLAVLAPSTFLFNHQVSCHHKESLVVQHTSFCLQQTCFEFCPYFHCICQDFISIGRRFNFDSQHMRLEDYLDKKQRSLSFSKLPHFWLGCICA